MMNFKKLSRLILTLTLIVSLVSALIPYHFVFDFSKNRVSFKLEKQNAQAAVSFKKGSFTKSTGAAPASQSITGVGFQPKAVIFFWDRQSSEGFAANQDAGIGFAASATQERAVAITSEDNSNSASFGQYRSNNNMIVIMTAGGNPLVTATAELTSFDSDGFTINWTLNTGSDQASPFIIHYIAFGGSDITNAFAGDFNLSASTGNQSITGVGFQPDMMVFLWSFTQIVNSAVKDNEIGIGFAKSSTSRGATVFAGRDATGTNDAKRWQQRANAAILVLEPTLSPPVQDAVADFVSMDADGFTIYKPDAPTDPVPIFFLALKGGQHKVGTIIQPDSTGNQSTTGVGFQPVGLLMSSFNKVADNAITTGGAFSIGGAQSSSARGGIWFQDRDDLDPSEANMYTATTNALTLATGPSTIKSRTDFASFDSDGFTLNWTNIDAPNIPRQIIYWAIGSSAPPPEPISATSSIDTSWVKGGSTGKNFIFTVSNSSTSTAAIQWVKMTRPSANYTLTAGSATGWSASVSGGSTATFTGGSIAAGSSANFTVTADIASVDESQTAWTVNVDDNSGGSSPTTASASSGGALNTGIDSTAPTNVGISSVTADSNSQLTATAQTASDSASGLHSQSYWFDETSGNSGGSDSTDWQSSTSWVDTGLSASTQYCYRIKARDAVLNESAFSATSCQTTQAGADTTAPAAVTDLATSNPTASTLRLTWIAPGDDNATGTAATYDIRYSTSNITEGNWASATQASGEPTPQAAGSSESFTVSGLSASTVYYFAVKTSDEVPNTSALSNVPSGTTSDQADTTPPTISLINSTNITSSGATITWTTNESADSQVEYGITSDYGSQTTLDTNLVTSHSVSISSLSASTLYHYRVKSKDAASNLATSSDYTFTTASSSVTIIDYPNITDVNAVDITANSARITWTTNMPATAQVEYGLTPIITGSYEFKTEEFGVLNTGHSVNLTKLKGKTTYYYRVKSKNAYSYENISAESIFVTPVGDITPPVISNIKITAISHNALTIDWTTNEAADSQIEYGLTEKYGSITDLDSKLVTNHSVTIAGLTTETLYHYRVKSKDEDENESKSKDLTFTTNPPPDTASPTISEIKVVSLYQSTAKIIWETDEPATSKIIFGESSGNYPKETIEFATLVADHEVNLNDLKPSTVYYYKVKSRDAANNESLSEEKSFKTESLDIITEINIIRPSASRIGAKGTTISRLAIGEVTTEVPILASEGDKEPPEITISPFEENPTGNPSPLIKGKATDKLGVIAGVSYSTDNGFTWHPVKEVSGIGTFKISFIAQPIHLNDGNYSIIVRARDNSDNIGYSESKLLVIDKLPPVTGGNVILVGTQTLNPTAFGVVNTIVGITQRIVVSSTGGAIEIKLAATPVGNDKESESELIAFPLSFSKATNLWFGDINFQKAGTYNLKIVAIDGAGKISERQINLFKVFESGIIKDKKNNQPVGNASVSLFQYDESSDQWLLWPGEVYNQANPQITGNDGAYRFLVPPGKYYLTIEHENYRDFYSQIMKFNEHRVINIQATLLSKLALVVKLPFFGGKKLNLAIPDFFSAARISTPSLIVAEEVESIKNLIGKPAPLFAIQNTKGEEVDIRYQRGKKLILTTWTTWSSLAQSQIPLLEEIAKEDSEVKVILLSIQESGGIADVYLRRGGYGLSSVVDREGELLKSYPIITLPQHFIIDRKGIIRDIYIGFLNKGELKEKIKNL